MLTVSPDVKVPIALLVKVMDIMLPVVVPSVEIVPSALAKLLPGVVLGVPGDIIGPMLTVSPDVKVPVTLLVKVTDIILPLVVPSVEIVPSALVKFLLAERFCIFGVTAGMLIVTWLATKGVTVWL
jgi:hypothetical protein